MYSLDEYKEAMKTYESPSELKLVGPEINPANKADGIYVIPEHIIKTCNKCITIGVGPHITFEEAIAKQNTNMEFYFFDHTVDSLPIENVPENFHYYKLGVGEIDVGNIRCIDTIFKLCDVKPTDRVLFKIDVEGAEYQAMPYETVLNKCACIVIEVHDIIMRFNSAVNLFKKLNENFSLVHTRGTPWDYTFYFNNMPIPNVQEMTYVNINEYRKQIKTKFYTEGLDVNISDVNGLNKIPDFLKTEF